MKAILLATVAAIAVQPLVLFAWLFLPALIAGGTVPPKDLVGMSLFSALLASPFVVVVGIPAFLLLRYLRHLSWWSLGTIGLVAASCPVAVFGLFEYAGYSSGGNWYGTPVEFVINGQKTFYGWLSYAQSVVFSGYMASSERWPSSSSVVARWALTTRSRRTAPPPLNSSVRPQMKDYSVSTKVLLTETLRFLPQFLAFVVLLALSYGAIYFALGSSKFLAAMIAILFALAFFTAPFASSRVRATNGVRLFTHAGSKTLLFCFAWGCMVGAGFVATLQAWQGMDATVLNYVVASVVAGLACVVTATIPSGRKSGPAG